MAYTKLTIGLAVAVMSLVGFGACTDIKSLDRDDLAQAELLERDKKKWVEEDSIKKKNLEDSTRIAEENKRLYELYIEDLKAYKKTKHPVMFGWFAYWRPGSPDKTFDMDHLPDSVDFISNWGQQWNLDDDRKAVLARTQAKGTRVTAGFIIENVGAGNVTPPEGGWSTEPLVAIEQYARVLADSIIKYNYDGFDIDYEPAYRSPWKNGNHCGDWPTAGEPWSKNRPLISCSRTSNKEYENFFFTKLREFLPSDKMLNINGSIDWIDASVLHLFNYFVPQSYNNTASRWVSTAEGVVRKSNGTVKLDQFIYTETFQTSPDNANAFVRNYAIPAKSGGWGGIGAFHINEDYLYGPDYKNVKEAIRILNPPMGK